MAPRHSLPSRGLLRPRHTARPRVRWLLLPAAVVAVLGLVGGGAVALRAREAAATCSPSSPVVRVAAVPEIAGVVAGAAEDLGLPASGCLRFTVTPQEPSAVVASLGDRAVRPPDVWIPDSSLWLQHTDAEPVPPQDDPRSIASSPLVLAVSAQTAARLSSGARPEVADLVSAASAAAGLHLELSEQPLAPARVGAVLALEQATSSRPDARAALTALLRSAAPAASEAEPADRGRPEPTNAQRVGDLLSSDSRTDVVVPVPEQAVWGADSTRPVAGSSRPAAVAVYPGGATYDYPFVSLASSPVVRAAADRLLDVLVSRSGQIRVRAAGFRDTSGSGGSTLTSARGVDSTRPARPVGLDDSSLQQSLEQAEHILDAVSMDARLLAVIDISGSMDRPVPEAGLGATRFSLAKEAAVRGLGLYPDTTEVGLWVFSQAIDGGSDYRELVPVGPLTGGGRDRLRTALDATSPLPSGNTALYDTALAAVRAVRSGWQPGRVNAVVLLSDGENTDRTGPTLDQLVATLSAENDPARPVPVITIAYGPESDAPALARISTATGGASYTAPDPQQIGEVFLDAVGQRGCRPGCTPPGSGTASP